jgi:cysteine desulfurase
MNDLAHNLVYMDYAAATPMDERVLAAMQPYFSDRFYNPSATYLPARAVHQDLTAARQLVAGCLGVRPAEIIFTAGGSEANNLAIHGVMRQYGQGNVVASAIEHESVLAPAQHYDCRLAAVSKTGVIDIPSLLKLVDDHTVLVSVMYANNEIGTIQPIKQLADELAKLREQRRAKGNQLPLLLHSDAAQAGNYLDLHVSRLGIDMLTLNGGKIYGPKQSGALYVHAGIKLSPLIDGGGQERGMRSGTENIGANVGFATALQLAQSLRKAETARLQQLQQDCIDRLSERFPRARLNGSRHYRLPNNVHVTFPGIDNERLLIQLEEAGILAAAGSACSASNEEPSHVLRAVGLTDADAQASIRFTFGRKTTVEDIDRLMQTLGQLLAE